MKREQNHRREAVLAQRCGALLRFNIIREFLLIRYHEANGKLVEIQACIPRRLERPVWCYPIMSSVSESRCKVAFRNGQKYVLEYVYYL